MTTVDVGAGCLASYLPQVGFRPNRLWLRRWLLAGGHLDGIDWADGGGEV